MFQYSYSFRQIIVAGTVATSPKPNQLEMQVEPVGWVAFASSMRTLSSFTMRVGLYPSTSYPLHQDMAPSLLLNQLNNNNQARLVPHPQDRRLLQQRV